MCVPVCVCNIGKVCMLMCVCLCVRYLLLWKCMSGCTVYGICMCMYVCIDGSVSVCVCAACYILCTRLAINSPSTVHSKSYLVDGFEVKVLGSRNVMVLVLGLSFLGQDDGVLKQKHPPPVFGELHDGQVSLTENLSLLFDALFDGGRESVCVCVHKGMIGMTTTEHLLELD